MNKDKAYYYLMILNAHGGLIYHKVLLCHIFFIYVPDLKNLKNFVKKDINTDEFMKLASIFYTIEALSSTIVPVYFVLLLI